jgi:hypothetical protein
MSFRWRLKMRLSGVRRATLAAGLATVAALALSSCSAGQIAETSLKKPSNSGVNTSNSDRSVSIRNLQVVYNGPQGYAAGDSAPLQVALYNRTTSPIIVNVSSTPPAGESKQVIYAKQVGLSGGAPASQPATAPEPSGSRPPATPDTQTSNDNLPSPDPSLAGSATPATPPTPAGAAGAALEPARITIPAMGYVSFLPGDPSSLTLAGLSDKLVPGIGVNLTFEFSNGAAPLVLQATTGVPLSPAPRGSIDPGVNKEPEPSSE